MSGDAKFVFFAKTAWTGIKKNRKLYIPYIITGASMIMMFYITGFLTGSQSIKDIPGGENITIMLDLGKYIMAFFSAIFLFYTNSFLIRQRKKEFALYNILGMDKRGVGRVLLWETVFAFLMSFAAGSVAGIVLSKFSELLLLNLVKSEVSFSFSIAPSLLLTVFEVYGAIYLLIFLNSLRQIHTSSPVELIKSESVGEKPPKANYVLGGIGLIMLIAAYIISLRIKEPLVALMLFFADVALVIAATYIIFIAGSVVMCRLLQKNKKYYYSPDHFVSVSSMAYRMKRNGAGLASICIFATMVLVMLSGSASLYFGADNALENRYPQTVACEFRFDSAVSMSDAAVSELKNEITDEIGDMKITDIISYRSLYLSAARNGSSFTRALNGADISELNSMCGVAFIPVDDFNKMTGLSETLAQDEVMVYSSSKEYKYDVLSIDGMNFRNTGTPSRIFRDSMTIERSVESYFVIVPDLDTVSRAYDGIAYVYPSWCYKFSPVDGKEAELDIYDRLLSRFGKDETEELEKKLGVDEDGFSSRTANENDFYSTFGGVFFLGILLSAVFLFATVLIIYYKQISEGYEDRSRFEIMQKVGMTKKDIRRSINSQMLTVFALPLVGAVLHLAFAEPVLIKLLRLFALTNTKFLILISALSVLVFALFYIIVYRITSNVYYQIVAGSGEE